MPTPTLPELRANTPLTQLLARAQRAMHALVALGPGQIQEPTYGQLRAQLFARLHEADALLGQLGSSPSEARQFVRVLLGERQEAGI